MTRILFICLGNICRSPMAEYVMKDLTSKAGLSEQFEIASAATSAWEIGNPVYPPARQKLAEHGIDCNGKTARQMTRLDYARYNHLIGMDESNLCDILRLVGGDPQHKVSLLMAHEVLFSYDNSYYTHCYHQTVKEYKSNGSLIRSKTDYYQAIGG